MIKLSKLSLLAVLFAIQTVDVLADPQVQNQSALTKDTAMAIMDKHFTTDQAKRAAKVEYSRLLNERYEREHKTIFFTNEEFNNLVEQVCAAGGLSLDNCKAFANDLVANIGIGKGLKTSLCSDGRMQNATMRNGAAKIYQNVASMGLDFCHFLNSDTNFSSDNDKVGAIKEYVQSVLGDKLTNVNCPLSRTNQYKDFQTGTINTIPGNPAEIAVTDARGNFSVVKCDIAVNFPSPATSSYFVFDSSKKAATPKPVNKVETPQRKVGDACATDDLSNHATHGVYITGGVSKWDCTDKNGKTVKCSCAARGCEEPKYEIARNANGASLGYCKAAKQSREEIAPIDVKPQNPVSLPTKPLDNDAALRQSSTPTVDNRCTRTNGMYHAETNSCLCPTNLHMVTMKPKTGVPYCVCDYDNGYIASSDGKTCELTESARKKLERQQRRDQKQAAKKTQPTSGENIDDILQQDLDKRLNYIMGGEGMFNNNKTDQNPQPTPTPVASQPEVVSNDLLDPIGDNERMLLGW